MTKSELRLEMLSRLKALTPQQRESESEKIARHFNSFVRKKNAHSVMLFASLRTEPETRFIHETLLGMGVEVSYPFIIAEGEMEARRVDDLESLVLGQAGVKSPVASLHPQVDITKLEIVAVPGLAFSHDYHRLGRGGGYYDRFLARLPTGVIKVGLAFDFQKVEIIPNEVHDQKMDVIF